MGKTFKDSLASRREMRRAPKEERRHERGGHRNLLRSAMDELRVDALLDWEEIREEIQKIRR